MELTVEQRQEILDQIHQRESLEKQALKEQKAAREAEAQRLHHQELSRAMQQQEDERKQNIVNLLNSALNQLQKAIAAFSEGDETQAYRLLVRVEEHRFSAVQRLTRPLQRPDATGLPTIRIKADNPLGFAIINGVDFVEGLHQLFEEDTNG